MSEPTTRVIDNGIWDIEVRAAGTICHINNKGEWFPSDSGFSGRSHKTMLKHANLIADAFNVAAGTGLTPRQMHEQIKKLREALQMAVTQNEHDKLLTGDELRLARAALQATERKTT